MLDDSLQQDEPLPRQLPDQISDPVESLVVILDLSCSDQSLVAGEGKNRFRERSNPKLEGSAEDVDVDVVEREGRVAVEGFLERRDERGGSSCCEKGKRSEKGVRKVRRRREEGRTDSVDSLFLQTSRLDLVEEPVDDSRN